MKKPYSLRKFFNDIHLWLGIASGLVLFIVCLSGTIYTFRTEVEEMLEPDKYTVAIGNKAMSPDELVQRMEQESGGKVTAISIPEDRARAYVMSVKKAGEERGENLYVNPYTGKVTGGQKGPASEFFGTVMKIHRWLLMEDGTGRIIVGSATIIFAFLVLSGLVLWFPVKRKNWKQGFKVKTNGNWKRLNHDLHNTLGFYSSILLLIMALTGLCWSFEWYKEGLSQVMGAEVFKGRKEKPLPSAIPAQGAVALSAAAYLQQANTVLAYAGDTRLTFAADSASSVVVTKSKGGFMALAASDKVQLDQYTGTPLQVELFADKPLNEQVVALIKPLHLGEVYGLFSKILYFFACLFATSLPVTGTIIWINKLRKKPKKKKGVAAQVQTA
ncbi:PepSY domain-containing protein [Pontibacter sp. JH31]|uniref:PepSY domain-containing protein n=1 Tax=Pontibacter aquaedesilientis TaxID=2766980 RepID=A0ABR7XFP0_9BACT|nr:PepSY-associated TM helix domain-containing protein [Pontibacter aquaedesilientis]MBD1397117.1 PepSY domain-containing protein [Pontibacter aquaedesilientis]